MTKHAIFTDWKNYSANKQGDGESQSFDVDKAEKMMTDGGQEIVLDQLSAGKSWEDSEADKSSSTLQTSLRGPTNARTTFPAKEAKDEVLFNRLWELQHDRGHTYEGWDGNSRIRIETVDKYEWARIALSRVNVDGVVQQEVLQRVMAENLTGFSRHYSGTFGATLGFACLYTFETKREAKGSQVFDSTDAILDDVDAPGDADGLVDYIWGKYGGSGQ